MPTVAYLEGIDPLVLTRLSLRGVGTLPVSNGFDNHGKFVNSLSERDAVDLVIGYLHKFLATQRQGFFVEDLLQSCRDCHVPVLVIVPEEAHPVARQALARVSDIVNLVSPGRLYDEVIRLLGAA